MSAFHLFLLSHRIIIFMLATGVDNANNSHDFLFMPSMKVCRPRAPNIHKPVAEMSLRFQVLTAERKKMAVF
jgi:hypothetical protein